jgi:uncharacterized membrane protein
MLRWGIWLGPIVGLLLALSEMPYGYYQLLRVIVFCASAYLVIAEGKQDNGFWLWAFVASALIYNPVFKLSLGREIWAFVNLATIALFAIHFWMRKRLHAS